eukprot:06650_3
MIAEIEGCGGKYQMNLELTFANLRLSMCTRRRSCCKRTRKFADVFSLHVKVGGWWSCLSNNYGRSCSCPLIIPYRLFTGSTPQTSRQKSSTATTSSCGRSRQSARSR